jgi:hypothetical protein
MKRNIQVLVFSVLTFGLSGAALSATNDSPFPADSSEFSYTLPAKESYAERQARMGEKSEVWGVSKREPAQPHNPFPFGGGQVDGSE